MAKQMHRNPSVDVHQFSMIPKSDVPRSAFVMQHTHKTTFDSGYLIPLFRMEVIPGDAIKLDMTAFVRLATPLFPVMDNLHLDSQFFFVPYRLLWTNFVKMMGEQTNPGDSISYTTPQTVSKASGYDINSLFDYLGLPTLGQVAGANTVTHSALVLRAYNKIYNAWYRDENLQNSVTENTGDGPDLYTDYTLLRRGKRKDYFTGALPWPQKGATAVTLPLGSTAPIISSGNPPTMTDSSGTFANKGLFTSAGTASIIFPSNAPGTNALHWGNETGMVADLTNATAATINAIRLAFQTQRLLEKDARGGTRYTEVIQQHFGVHPEDFRLQRPEYLGGASTPITVNPIAQTSGTSASGTTTPLGTLAAMGTGLANGHGFTYSVREHGIILGIVSVRADLTYQQGLERFWSRLTRYDHYWPVFQALGEQAILNKEIYCDGSANDANAFGYTPRWDEYRYMPSRISGLFRSTASGTIDPWHLAQKFTSLPSLNTTFIQDTPPVSRVVAVGTGANGQQLLCDSFFNVRAVRPLPMHSVPGMVDHF